MSSENYIIKDQNAPHFLTFTTVDWIDVFTREGYKNILIDSLKYCQQSKGLQIFAWCLMSNHIHLVCRVEEPFLLSDFVRDFKKYTAKAIISVIQYSTKESRREWLLDMFVSAGKYDNRIKKYKFWQDGCHPIQLENNEMVDQRINYTHENPVRATIVENPEDYLYGSARNYAGLNGFLDLIIVE